MRRLLLALLVVLSGCAGPLAPLGDETDAGPETNVETDGRTTDQPDATANGGGSRTVSDADITVTVTRVVDGDTLKIVYDNGTEDTVRLLGVDTPEVHTETTPDEFEGVPDTEAGRECLQQWGHRASELATEELSGHRVGLVFDQNEGPRGYYGRLLAYVGEGEAMGTAAGHAADAESFNQWLVAEGYARVYDSSFSEQKSYDAAEQRARERGLGLWECATDPPPTATETATPDGQFAISVHPDAAGNDNENLNDEYVTLRNRGETAQSLDGWTVRDEAGKSYTFGSVRLDAGAAVTLHTGRGADTQTDVYWNRTSAVWNNGGDTVTVRDANGTVVAERTY